MRRLSGTFCLGLCLFFLLFSPVKAAENPDFSGKLPQVGDWLEYIVSYPAVSLEQRLFAEAKKNTGSGEKPEKTGENTKKNEFSSNNKVKDGWQSYPLRLEFKQVNPGSYELILTTRSGANAVSVVKQANFIEKIIKNSASDQENIKELADLPPAGQDERDKPVEYFDYALSGNIITVTVKRSEDHGEKLLRWLHPDLPFALARFSSSRVDLLLVGYGSGAAPDFPLQVEIPALPE